MVTGTLCIMEDSKKLRAARLKLAREAAGFTSGADFVRALNRDKELIVESTYRSYENGTRTITYEAAKIMAQLLKVDAVSIMEGTQAHTRIASNAPKKVTEPETIRVPDQTNISWTADLPVKGMAECGPSGWCLLNGEQIELTDRPPYLAGASKAFAVYIQGDSMQPALPQGTLAYIHPGKPVGIGDYVLVELAPEPGESTPRAILKLLEKRSPAKITLRQLNPSKTIEVKTAEIEHIYKVVGVAFR